VQTYPRIPDSWSRLDARAAAVPDDMPQPSGRRAESETRIEVERAADRVPSPAAAAPSASAELQADYDIEAELADAIAEDLDARSFARNRKARKPIGTVKLGNETVVVCDDGSTWRKSERGWRQVTPLPGTPVLGREPRIERAG
jgi:regulator of protease activity HflC (stomatin/prohibitin superfamily)